jgi:predicted pyridoxine 5'-phosphate oxidase superfamily flavin-nucleotide-binding protein
MAASMCEPLAFFRDFIHRSTGRNGTKEIHTVKLPETLLEVLKKDSIVAIATLGPDGPHMVNTWNSYVRVSEDGRLLIPAGYFHKTEANIAANNQVLVTLGSSKVQGLHGPGAGFLIKGTAAFLKEGPEYDATKSTFGWARAVLSLTVDSATQTI